MPGRVDDLEEIVRLMSDTNKRLVHTVDDLRLICRDLVRLHCLAHGLRAQEKQDERDGNG